MNHTTTNHLSTAQRFVSFFVTLIRKIRLRIGYKRGALQMPVLPIAIDLEPVNSCNFRCPHCQVTHWNKEKAELDQSQFATLLNQLPGVAEIKLQGMGEPLLNKQVPAMLKLADEQNIEMKFISNGSVMTQTVIDQLVSLQSASVTFSIDGATADTFEKIRVGGKFKKVIDNIRQLVEIRNERKSSLKIFVWTVVTKQNVDELVPIVELSHDLGVDRLAFQVFLSDWGKDEMKDQADAKRIEFDDATNDKLDAALHKAAVLFLPFEVFRSNLRSKKNKCPWPWERTFIAANGDVVPCCVIADSDTAKMGNVFETNLEDIWNAEPYRELRQRIRDHDLPEYCKNCYGEG